MHFRRWTGLVLALLGCAGLSGCTDKGRATAKDGGVVADGGARPDAAPPKPLNAPARSLATVDDLAADDLRLISAKQVNPTVTRFDLLRTGDKFQAIGGRAFRAKWKPLGPGGSEAQEGFDGNNSPRCEVAAWRLDRMLFRDVDPAPPIQPVGSPVPTPELPYLVPRVIVRALHRDVPCNRACAHLPKLATADTPPTFPEFNDHLVLGALTQWVEDAKMPRRFHGDLWNEERFAQSPAYRRSISDLMLFLFLIAHGDANNATNFLLRAPALDRVYTVDNGRSLDGVPVYSETADPEWNPLALLSPTRLIVPSFSRRTLEHIEQLSPEPLRSELFLVAAVELQSGRTVVEPKDAPELASLRGRALSTVNSLTRRSRQTYTGTLKTGGPPWLLLGISESGITELVERAQRLTKQLKAGKTPLFD